jgi:hypothetical protein
MDIGIPKQSDPHENIKRESDWAFSQTRSQTDGGLIVAPAAFLLSHPAEETCLTRAMKAA